MFGRIKSSECASNELFCVRLRARSGAGEISALLLRFQSPFSFLGHESAILPSQKRDRLAFTMLNLVHRALARVFVGAPAKKFCAVSKPAAGEMVVRDFHDNFGRDWFPLASPLGAPAAWPSGRVTGEPGRFFQCFKFVRYRPAFRSLRSKAARAAR